MTKPEGNIYRLLFLCFFKIGSITFGGGYAMLPIIEEEITKKRKLITKDEMLTMLAIAESTPGPISVNLATFTGYKMAGILGAAVSTLGLCITPVIFIIILSFFYEAMKEVAVISAAFEGVRVGVILLILKAAISLGKGILGAPEIVILVCAFICSLFSLVPSIVILLSAMAVGLIFSLIKGKKGGVL